MSDRPASLEVRVMKDNGLLRAGELRPGDSLRLPGGNILTLHGTPSWARLRGSRDSALWLAWVGFALVMAGGVMVFGMVKVDACVVVTPAGGRERVFVALKPARFAPMFQERFQRLVREQGAPA
jgi:hypothetical protein